MKFVDEATIRVQAGKGGAGCLSFRREKNVERGGPNGGDGGDGGSVYIVATEKLNTLMEFRYQRRFAAQNGQSGMGKDRIGKGGDDNIIEVPIGTSIYDRETGELIGDLIKEGAKILVAQGGFHGLGNARFKSSINRTPRQTTQGTPGEARELRLELKLLANVGVLGLPNAGKSSLIHAISAAKPKIADYPFTTLHPKLGVVRVGPYRSFMIADIPGIIEGAAEGAGLGIKFLKHISRTGLLLHVVDMVPLDGSEALDAIRTIEKELVKFGHDVSDKPRWLVLNKSDLLLEEEQQDQCDALLKALAWDGPHFMISALQKRGCDELCEAIMTYLESFNLSA